MTLKWCSRWCSDCRSTTCAARDATVDVKRVPRRRLKEPGTVDCLFKTAHGTRAEMTMAGLDMKLDALDTVVPPSLRNPCETAVGLPD